MHKRYALAAAALSALTVCAVSACGSAQNAVVTATSTSPAVVLQTQSCLAAEGVCTAIPDPANYVVGVELVDAMPGTLERMLPLAADGTVTVPADLPANALLGLRCAQPEGSGSCDPNTAYGSDTHADLGQKLYWLKKEYAK